MNGDWTPSDAAGINDFLNTALGRKWLGVLLAHKPRVNLENTEKAALTGAFIAGYEHLLFGEMGVTRSTGQAPPNYSRPGIDPEKD